MKKKYAKGALMCFLLSISTFSIAQLSSLPPSGANQKSVTRQYLGSFAFVEITYNSPDVAGREGQIWGQLVPYGMQNLSFGLSTAENPSPWRAGANENTTIEFSHDMELQGKAIKAGKYGLHVVPAESGPWTIILSKENNAWGSYFYTPGEDALRVEALSEESEYNEFLTYEFTERKVDAVQVALIWENKRLPFSITMANQNEVILASLTSELKNAAGFSWTNWVNASNWASNAGFHEQAIMWAEKSVNDPFTGQRNFQTLSLKVNVFFKAGKISEALAAVDDAMKSPDANVMQVHSLGRQLIVAGQYDKALEVFEYNHKANNKVWPTNYGLARGFSAKGDYKNALKYLKIAQKQVPEGDTQNPPVIEANIKKLEKGEDIN